MPYILIHRFASGLKLAFEFVEKPYYLNKYIVPSPNLPVTDCMSFYYMFRTLRSGNSHDSRTQLRMSAHGIENIGEAETGIIEGREENGLRFCPELVDERIKVSLERLHV